MARSDMSDLEWEFIKAALPNITRGKKRVDDRRVINGIFYVMSCAPASPGLICPANTADQQRSTITSTDGAMRATGTGSWTPSPTCIAWTQ